MEFAFVGGFSMEEIVGTIGGDERVVGDGIVGRIRRIADAAAAAGGLFVADFLTNGMADSRVMAIDDFL